MNLKYELRNGWKVINEMNNIDAVMKYSDEYMDFLNKGKTERKCVKEIEKMAIEKGFKSILDIEKVSPIFISTLLPSLNITTPYIARGIVTHWYFFIPP